MKKIITTLFSVLLLLSVFTFNVSAYDVPDVYKPLIQKYIDGLSGTTSYEYDALGSFGSDVWISPIPGEINDDFGFSLFDMNQDGTQELFVGSKSSRSWASVYTIENNQPKQIAVFREIILLMGDLAPIGHPEYTNTIFQTDSITSSGEMIVGFYKLDGTNLVEVGQANAKDFSGYIGDYSQVPEPFITFNEYRSTPVEVEEGPIGTIYRLLNRQSGEHLYTPDHNEAQTLANSGWNYEGIGWTAPTEGEAVYRLYNPSLNDHLYTTDTNEVNVLTSQNGWQTDNNGNPLFYSGGDKPIYRVYSDSTGRHHLTTDENEYNTLPGLGWTQEGIKLHGIA